MMLLGFMGGVEIILLFGVTAAGIVAYLISREKTNSQKTVQPGADEDSKLTR